MCAKEVENTPRKQECAENKETTLCLKSSNCNSRIPILATHFIKGQDLQEVLFVPELSELRKKIDIRDLWNTLSLGLYHYSTNHRKGKICAHRDIKPANIMAYQTCTFAKFAYTIQCNMQLLSIIFAAVFYTFSLLFQLKSYQQKWKIQS